MANTLCLPGSPCWLYNGIIYKMPFERSWHPSFLRKVILTMRLCKILVGMRNQCLSNSLIFFQFLMYFTNNMLLLPKCWKHISAKTKAQKLLHGQFRHQREPPLTLLVYPSRLACIYPSRLTCTHTHTHTHIIHTSPLVTTGNCDSRGCIRNKNKHQL